MKQPLFKQKIKFSIPEQMRFAKSVGTLLSAGMNISEALSFAGKSMKGKRKKVINLITEGVSRGFLCADIFSETEAFDKSFIQMISIGEKTGSLGMAFSRTALLLEKRIMVSRKIYSSLIYPVFIASATTVVSIFLIVYIFPKIIPLITSMNITLPFLTRLLILISHIFIYHWFTLFSICGSVFLVVTLTLRFSQFARRANGILLMSLPIFGTIFRSRILIEIFNSLSILLSHGEHLPAALISVAEVTHNNEYADALKIASAHVTRGGTLSSYISDQLHLFPQLAVDFIATGEKSGGLADACEHITLLYEASVDDSVKYLSLVIEPLLMLGMGLVVGGIALSIVMPIYEITTYLSK